MVPKQREYPMAVSQGVMLHRTDTALALVEGTTTKQTSM